MMEENGKGTTISLETLVRTWSLYDSTVEEILETMRPMKETTRECIIVAKALHETKLARKIEQANDRLLLIRINDFRSAVQVGTYREFLKSLSWAQMVSLLTSIEHFSIKYPEEEGLTDIESELYKAILRTALLEKANEEVRLQNECALVLERKKC